MRSERAIRTQLRKVIDLKDTASSDDDKWIMYGAEQALAWALHMDAAPPSVLAAPAQMGRGQGGES